MMRPRQYDLQSLRECVTGVFQAHGYRGTSISMLTDASGLGKQSLYNALGDKEAAYVQSLDCAGERLAAMTAAMAEAPDGRRALDLFFARAVEGCSSDSTADRSCMVTAGLMEGIEADAITRALHQKWGEMALLLQRTVERGQRDGSVRADVDSAALRDLLAILMLGLRVASRTPTAPAALDATVRWVLKLLDAESPAP